MIPEVAAMIAENKRRNAKIFCDYDPISGVGCYDFDNRTRVRISDITYNDMYVPKECMEYELFRDIAKYRSVRLYVMKKLRREFSQQYLDFFEKEIYRIRMREDPEFAIYLTDKIVHKKTG